LHTKNYCSADAAIITRHTGLRTERDAARQSHLEDRSSQMHLDNDWYGHRRILSEYCRTSDKPAFATILHGWIINVNSERGYRRIKSAPYLMWNYRHLVQGRKLGIPNIDAIGAPFTYLDKITKRPLEKPKGTVLFPQHYTDKVHHDTSHHDLIDYVERRFPSPYTVSIFYKEPNFQELNDLYARRNWKVFCAGARSDPFFLKRLYKCLAEHECTVSNDFSSALAYAAYLGRDVLLLKDHLWPKSAYFIDTSEPVVEKMSTKLFDGLDGDDARRFGFSELGGDLMLTPTELSRKLGWHSRWKKGAARTLSLIIDLKYGRAFRRGARDL